MLEGTAQLGYPPETMFTLGMLLSQPRRLRDSEDVGLGALLLTGFLGGAIATHLRLEHPLFTHTLFPIYVAALVWGGLFLRDARLRALLPIAEGSMSETCFEGRHRHRLRAPARPAVILVDGALCSRAFGPMPKLAPLLARHFTVYVYDRRGRGQSGDTQPYRGSASSRTSPR